MNFECIIYEKSDGIATIQLNRPKVLNAMNKQLWLDIQAALDAESYFRTQDAGFTGIQETLGSISPIDVRIWIDRELGLSDQFTIDSGLGHHIEPTLRIRVSKLRSHSEVAPQSRSGA